MRALNTIMLALLLSGTARAETPAFDPRDWQGDKFGRPTQVLTIGSPHLGQIKAVVTPEMLAPLLDKLAATKPDIITHEGLSGEQCDTVKRYAAKYPGIYEDYCWPTDDAEKATGLTIPAAMAQIDKVLAAWPAQPSAAQRRHLAALFIAAGERSSAQVQWRQLPEAERKLGDGIDAALLKIVSRAGARPNETYDVAVALAVRLGLQRVYAVDDHTADSVQALDGPELGTFLEAHWGTTPPPALARISTEPKLANGADVLEYYRLMNRPATQRLFVSWDFRRAMNAASPQQHGRVYLAWYEVRNLRMVANIRAAFGNRPGARVLNIVGASHKGYYDAYLGMMSDVKLVDAETVLK